MALTGIWTACLLGVLAVLPSVIAMGFRQILAVAVFTQMLIGAAGVHEKWRPLKTALGVEPESRYLDDALLPSGVRYPLRRWLNVRLGPRDKVYVWGDDDGSYIDARVHLDYESTPALLLWRLAASSRDADSLRRCLRQRGFTWMIYSLHWPVLLANNGKLDFRESDRALMVMQEFWRRWTESVIGAYPVADTHGSPAWAVKLRNTPRVGPMVVNRWRQPELLPGTLPLVWRAVKYERDGDAGMAIQVYRDVLVAYPGYAFAMFPLARLLAERGKAGEANRYLAEAARLGWILAKPGSGKPGRKG
jgi:hypothetical protein